MSDTLSVFGFPDRAAGYHSLWVARAFTAWGAISFVTGGLLAVPVLDQAVGTSAPPHVLVVVSRSLGVTLDRLGTGVEIGLMVLGLGLLLLWGLAFVLDPDLYDRARRAPDEGGTTQPVLRLAGAVQPSRVLKLGALFLLLPALARGFADTEIARYLWGLGIFTMLSSLVVGVAYMAAPSGRSTFDAVARVLYLYLAAALVSVCGLFVVMKEGPWALTLRSGLALPGPGLLVRGLHLWHHGGAEDRRVRAERESAALTEARERERDRLAARERDAQASREHEIALEEARARRERESSEAQAALERERMKVEAEREQKRLKAEAEARAQEMERERDHATERAAQAERDRADADRRREAEDARRKAQEAEERELLDFLRSR